MLKTSQIILASTSPRRRELFSQLNIEFTSVAPRYEETPQPNLSCEQAVLYFAKQKALSLCEDFPDSLIIGSDTMIEFEGSALGKPKDAQDAIDMLMKLSGKTHRVLTAVAILETSNQKIKEYIEASAVTMKLFSKEEAESYVATGEPLDKAGSYAVQGIGKKLIVRVEGDLNNVIGLPLEKLSDLLKNF